MERIASRSYATADGEFVFTMVWQSLDTPYKIWAEERRVKKYETFFVTEVSAEVVKIDAEQRLVGKSKKRCNNHLRRHRHKRHTYMCLSP